MNYDIKKRYEQALEEFIPLRNKEIDGEQLSKKEVKRYLELVEGYLLPLSRILFEKGEVDYLEQKENQFTYII